ncbi:MAG: FtsX-like permease family protein [Treponema sp.]|jgi:ABC-type antimicrobial peptide transport system permease subunit|nr:FtsX-like permease family protein [Treponema sp.]
MKFVTLITLAAKYLVRYRRRYFFLFLALSMGFSIVTLMTAIKDRMYANVYKSAQDHYAGDIVVVGYDSDNSHIFHLTGGERTEVYRAMEAVHFESPQVVERTHFPQEGVLYFNGSAVRLKYVIGVDWENEAAYFDSLAYRERLTPPIPEDAGGPGEGAETPEFAADFFSPSESFSGMDGMDQIYLSAPVASLLQARVGDSLILEVNTRQGQKNTAPFIVGGIVEDSTIFGYYKAYIDRVTLNRLLLFNDEDCSIIGIFVKNRWDVENKRALLQRALQNRLAVGPIVHNREELDKAIAEPYQGIQIFLITLAVYLSEVADLLGAMSLITYFLYTMMLIIMMVSALVTYRLILHERRRELGTMRAVGFYGADIRFILMLETFGLALVSLAAGFLLAFFFQWLVTFISFSWFPSFEIFLENGKLKTLYLSRTVAVNILAVFVSLFTAAIAPVYRSSREPLPGMLSGGH